jgi:hypothetical protein
MKAPFRLAVLALVFTLAPGPCFALREIAPLTRKEAKEMGLDVRVLAAGPDAVRLELEFKPEGKLEEFTHVELSVREGKDSLVLSTSLRATRTEAGSRLVTLTVGRAFLEGVTLSLVMHSPAEAGDHTYELRMKEFAEAEEGR